MPWNRPDSLKLVRRRVKAGDLPPTDPRTAECYKFALASKGNKSVNEIAREWGVSRQALHKRLARLERWLEDGCPDNYKGGYNTWKSREAVVSPESIDRGYGPECWSRMSGGL